MRKGPTRVLFLCPSTPEMGARSPKNYSTTLAKSQEENYEQIVNKIIS